MSTRRREAILDQATELIIENGLGDLTMGKVAQRVGFTEPAMYRHFKSKQDLVIAIIRRLAAHFEELFQRFDPGNPPQVFLADFFTALLTYLQRVRGVTLLFLSESAYNRDHAIRAELLELFMGHISRISTYLDAAAVRGELRAGVDPAAAALVFVGMVQATITRFLLSSRPTSADADQRALDIFLKGLMA